jgi:4-amino-4-deoxy-L-arabinose transferase-like glycosyltransferase
MSSPAGRIAPEPAVEFGGLDPLSPETKRRLLGLAALLALSLLPLVLLSPLFGAPFEPDEGVYATIARGWREGAVPYRDLWDNKGPLLFLWYVASFTWLGESVVAPRVLAGLAAGACVPFVWLSARNLLGQREATFAAAIYALSFVNLYIQVTANGEVFMLLPMTAGLWAFSNGARGGSLRWFLLAGALTSLATFTRQSALWAFIGYGAWLGVLFLRVPEERWAYFKAGAALAVGAIVAAVPIVVYFAVQGALYELWHAMFAFNWSWASRTAWYMKLVPPIILNPLPLLGGLAFWSLAAIGVWRLARRGGRAAWLVLSFLGFSEAATQTMGTAFPHYAVQLLPGAALAGAVGLSYVIERWRAGRRVPASALALAAGVTLAGATFVYMQPTPAERFEAQYGFRDNAEDAIAAAEIADAVEAMTEPTDYVYEWGRESEIYWLADRQPASRWLHNRPYKVDKSVMDEIIADLDETRPAVILFTLEEEQLAAGAYTPPEEIRAYLDEHYRYAGRVGYADLYEREGTP